MEIKVLFTDLRGTQAAMHSALALARDLNATLEIIVPQLVPYPLPITSPPVPLDFIASQIRQLAASAGIRADVQIYLCRDPLEILCQILHPHSLITIGVRNTWLPNRARHLADMLRREGHEVITARYR